VERFKKYTRRRHRTQAHMAGDDPERIVPIIATFEADPRGMTREAAPQARLRRGIGHGSALQSALDAGRRLRRGVGTLHKSAEELMTHPVVVPDSVFMSDGGHVENLGVLPLLDARCSVILALDGGADPDESCESLTKALDIARRTIGTEFEALDRRGEWTGDVERVVMAEGTILSRRGAVSSLLP